MTNVRVGLKMKHCVAAAHGELQFVMIINVILNHGQILVKMIAAEIIHTSAVIVVDHDTRYLTLAFESPPDAGEGLQPGSNRCGIDPGQSRRIV